MAIFRPIYGFGNERVEVFAQQRARQTPRVDAAAEAAHHGAGEVHPLQHTVAAQEVVVVVRPAGRRRRIPDRLPQRFARLVDEARRIQGTEFVSYDELW